MNREREVQTMSGWGMLGLGIVLVLLTGYILVATSVGLAKGGPAEFWPLFFRFGGSVLIIIAAVLIFAGLFILQPNQAGVLLLFGRYIGTVKTEGFKWANPFYTKKKISLRLRNLNGQKLKVNDKAGNPIEIAVVVVWKVENTFAACFEVDEYEQYVTVQSESAVRHLATAYPYDSWEDEDIVTLRGNVDQVSKALEKELQDRLDKAGVNVLEARLSHLAYSPEIAEAMLRRQQATAIIAARQRIVEGAVGMVQTALEMLSAENVVELDEERRATMVSNLLVVLCGEAHVQPVVNTGTLYS